MRSSISALLLLAFVFSCFSSCREDSTKTVIIQSPTARPVLDHSTPDRLVKSAWTYAAWEVALRNDSILVPPFLSDITRKAVIASHANQSDEYAKEIEKFEILKVNSESESRATVLAWERKDTILYVLSNSGTGWLVEDRQQKCWNCLGTGKEIDLDAWKRGKYSTPTPNKKQCSKCQGRGITSSYYQTK
jgi:hypothetical protein